MVTCAVLLVHAADRGQGSVDALVSALKTRLGFAGVNLSAFRLRKRIGTGAAVPLLGAIMAAGSLIFLLWHIWQTSPASVVCILAVYSAAILLEIFLTLRRGLRRWHANHSGQRGR